MRIAFGLAFVARFWVLSIDAVTFGDMTERLLAIPESLVNEALVLSAVLGMCKPGYVVLAGLYLLPLLGRRRNRDRWPLVFAPVLGALMTVVWNAAVSLPGLRGCR